MIEERRVSEVWANHQYKILERDLNTTITEESIREAYYKTTNKQDFVKAVRVLIHYLKERKLIPTYVAAELLDMRILKPVKSKVREVYLTDEEIVEGLNLMRSKWDDDTVMLYKFLVYTGMRPSHAIRVLRNFDRRELEFRENVAILPMMKYVVGEEKRAYVALMPAHFAEELRPFKIELKETSWKSRLNPRKWKPPVDSRIDANAIRKWHMNFLVRHKIDSALVNFIQGRSPEDVGSARY